MNFEKKIINEIQIDSLIKYGFSKIKNLNLFVPCQITNLQEFYFMIENDKPAHIIIVIRSIESPNLWNYFLNFPIAACTKGKI